MIASFRHRGLERLFRRGDRRRINPRLVAKIERVLARIDDAAHPLDLDLPGYRLHRLTGNFQHTWSVTVSANWRITISITKVQKHMMSI